MSVLDLGYLKSEIPKTPDLKTFFKMLRIHDWYFSMSDDHRVWKSGQNEHDQIMAICKQSEKHKKIYDAFKNYLFDGKKMPEMDDFS